MFGINDNDELEYFVSPLVFLLLLIVIYKYIYMHNLVGYLFTILFEKIYNIGYTSKTN